MEAVTPPGLSIINQLFVKQRTQVSLDRLHSSTNYLQTFSNRIKFYIFFDWQEEKNADGQKKKSKGMCMTADDKELFPSSSHLSIGLLRLLPADHHRVLWDNVSLDVSGRAGRGLLSRPSIHACRGGALADAVEGRHSDLILGVGIQPPDAVAGGGDAVHSLVLALRPFGSVLDDVVGDWVWVAGVPGDGHTGGGGFRDNGCAGRLRQSLGIERGGNERELYFQSTLFISEWD